jgi:hypothetical protein
MTFGATSGRPGIVIGSRWGTFWKVFSFSICRDMRELP